MLYLKLYDLKLNHQEIEEESSILDKCLDWTAMLLSIIKKNFIVDILKYYDGFGKEYRNFDVFQLINSISNRSVGTCYFYEVSILKSYLTDLLYDSKPGHCKNCEIAIWEKNKDNKQICIFHKSHVCKLFPNEYYIEPKVVLS